MPNKSPYIISLKFSPGLQKEFHLIGENLRRYGLSTKYILSSDYLQLGERLKDVVYIHTGTDIKGTLSDVIKNHALEEFLSIFRCSRPQFVCIYNFHPINLYFCFRLKRIYPDAILALFLHDPYKPYKRPYGLKNAFFISALEFIQKSTVRYMDYVISPSFYSSKLFKENYPHFKGQNIVAPLLIPDRLRVLTTDRRFFSIVGTANKATGHDTFVNLVNYVAEHNLGYEFALVSSSDVSKYLSKLNEKAKGIIKVINKKIITDYEIDDIIQQSWAVFRLDWEVTQSGVIPVSYMNGTPIIVRSIPGLTQHLWDRETGYAVPFAATEEEILRAMESVKKNFQKLSQNARKRYEDVWAEKNFEKYYSCIINSLQ